MTTDREILVYVDLQGTPHLAGRLWTRLRKDRENATFEYDDGWLEHRERFSLEPALKLGRVPFIQRRTDPSSAPSAIRRPTVGVEC